MSEPACRHCGDAPSHGLQSCCWCWVFEEGRPPHEGCPGCQVSSRRLAPIRARYRSAIEATRENCLAVMRECLKQPLEAMPRVLRVNFRQRPEAALQAVLETAYSNLETEIRRRVVAP